MSSSEESDTLVIGAGAAGLSAAYELAARGHHVTVLEARDRLGGRILTERGTFAAVPIELGAEFIHGESPVLFNWLRAAKDVAIDAARNRWVAHRTRLRPADERLQVLRRVFRRLPAPDPDMPFADFLHRHRRSVSPEVRQLACSMVEGFDAADASRISAREVLDEWGGPASLDGPTFRPGRGYDALIDTMRQALPVDRVGLRLGTIVRAVTWRRGRVIVDAERHGEAVRLQAARAIVTLPLGVLQLPASSPASVRFTPELRSKRGALAHLAAGPAVKVLMSFARPFWAELHDGRYRDAAFFFAPQAAFPTFWTSLPLRSPTLVAWCAGPKAGTLARRSRNEVIASVMDSLRAVFGRLDYPSMLEYLRWHDWQRDPFSCGAYSYVLARGAGARRSLARPLDDTLFFAGEACDTEGAAATVGGALQSGVRAARQVSESAGAATGRRSRRKARSPRHAQ